MSSYFSFNMSGNILFCLVVGVLFFRVNADPCQLQGNPTLCNNGCVWCRGSVKNLRTMAVDILDTACLTSCDKNLWGTMEALEEVRGHDDNEPLIAVDVTEASDAEAALDNGTTLNVRNKDECIRQATGNVWCEYTVARSTTSLDTGATRKEAVSGGRCVTSTCTLTGIESLDLVGFELSTMQDGLLPSDIDKNTIQSDSAVKLSHDKSGGLRKRKLQIHTTKGYPVLPRELQLTQSEDYNASRGVFGDEIKKAIKSATSFTGDDIQKIWESASLTDFMTYLDDTYLHGLEREIQEAEKYLHDHGYSSDIIAVYLLENLSQLAESPEELPKVLDLAKKYAKQTYDVSEETIQAILDDPKVSELMANFVDEVVGVLKKTSPEQLGNFLPSLDDEVASKLVQALEEIKLVETVDNFSEEQLKAVTKKPKLLHRLVVGVPEATSAKILKEASDADLALSLDGLSKEERAAYLEVIPRERHAEVIRLENAAAQLGVGMSMCLVLGGLAVTAVSMFD